MIIEIFFKINYQEKVWGEYEKKNVVVREIDEKTEFLLSLLPSSAINVRRGVKESIS